MRISLFNKKILTALSACCLAGLSYGQLSGNYTVGTGGNYPNLTGSTGLFRAINTSGMTGNVTATIISDIVEPATDSLKDFTGGGANTYRLNIKPDLAVLRNITATSSVFMVTFYGAKNVTIDGTFNGSGSYLRFSNDNGGVNAGTLKFVYGCSTDTVANCILESSNGVTNPGNFATQKGGTVVIDAAIAPIINNSNLVFKNNIFRDITGTSNGYPGCHIRAVDADPGSHSRLSQPFMHQAFQIVTIIGMGMQQKALPIIA